jgi:hypothetical protein
MYSDLTASYPKRFIVINVLCRNDNPRLKTQFGVSTLISMLGETH